MKNTSLTEQDHDNMDAFLGHILDNHKAGTITRAQAVSGLAHVMAALAEGNVGEARNWFMQGRKLVQR